MNEMKLWTGITRCVIDKSLSNPVFPTARAHTSSSLFSAPKDKLALV